MDKVSGPVIGIDLGTTYSAVCYYNEGGTSVIANEQGNRTTPSIVAFTDTERLIGDAARNQAAMNPSNTVYEIKRLMGRTWDDKKVQETITKFPFQVVDQNNKPCVKVKFMGEDKIFTPEEISAMILGDLKRTAESFLGQTVEYAVVTVPAYFTEQAKQATKDAATIAGLKVLRLLTEPTAACIAYGLDKDTSVEQTICVCDAGGGTYDISILSLCDGVFEVKAVGGDSFLGGADIDNYLVDYAKKEFMNKTGVDISDNAKAIRRLRTACEKAKRTLSSVTFTEIEVDSLAEGNDFNLKLSRAKLESLTSALIKKHIDLIEPVMLDAKVSKSQIDKVLMVGGTTRIPKLRELISEFFGKKLSTDINPDEAVAIGAAVQAAVLGGVKDDKIGNLLVLDVTPLSIGIETAGGVMTKIIDRNSTIPCAKNKTFSTYEDNQPAVDINIFQGERAMTANCNRLGTFRVTGLPPAPRGTLKIVVEMSLNADGILDVTAKEEGSGKNGTIKITNDTNRLSKDEIDRMVSDAEKYKDADDTIRKNKESYNKLDEQIHKCRSTITSTVEQAKTAQSDYKTPPELAEFEETLTTMDSWLRSHPDETFDVYEGKYKHIEDVLKKFTDKATEHLNSINPNKQDVKNPRSEPTVDEVD